MIGLLYLVVLLVYFIVVVFVFVYQYKKKWWFIAIPLFLLGVFYGVPIAQHSYLCSSDDVGVSVYGEHDVRGLVLEGITNSCGYTCFYYIAGGFFDSVEFEMKRKSIYDKERGVDGIGIYRVYKGRRNDENCFLYKVDRVDEKININRYSSFNGDPYKPFFENHCVAIKKVEKFTQPYRYIFSGSNIFNYWFDQFANISKWHTTFEMDEGGVAAEYLEYQLDMRLPLAEFGFSHRFCKPYRKSFDTFFQKNRGI